MTSCFCRALWGDDLLPEYGKVMKDVERTIQMNRHPENIHTFCFGKDNARWLTSLGVEPTVVSSKPVCKYTRRRVRICPGEDPSQIAHGISIWRHKLEVIYQALSIYDEIIWLDWDVVMHKPLPDDFWIRFAKRQPLQAVMRQLRNSPAYWRPVHGSQTPHGGLIYCREISIAKNLIALQHAWPGVSDEHIIGLLVELWFGDWNKDSIQRWKDDGYEPDCFKLRPGQGQAFAPKQKIFKHFG